MSESYQHQKLSYNATSSSASPRGYFSSLLRKVKSRLNSVYANKNESASLAASYATLPKKTKKTMGGSANSLRLDGDWPSQDSLLSSINSAQIFGTLPRNRKPFIPKNLPGKTPPTPPSSQISLSGSVGSSQSITLTKSSSTSNKISGVFTLIRSGSVSGSSRRKERNASLTSLATLPRTNNLSSTSTDKQLSGYFWEEADAAKQCHFLFEDCRLALDGVLVAVDRYFSFVDEQQLFRASSQQIPSYLKAANFTTLRHLASQYLQLSDQVNAAATQLFLILVELRNILNLERSHEQPDFVTAALLIPVGALLSHLARLCDLLQISAVSSCHLLSPSDSGISMKSSSATVSMRQPLNSPDGTAIGSITIPSAAQPLRNQTVHVINSLRETLNRIDEGLPAPPVSIVRKSTSVNDDLPKKYPTFKSTVTMNTSESTKPSIGEKSLLKTTRPAYNVEKSNRTSVRLQVNDSSQSPVDKRGHGKLSQLEKTLKTVSFESTRSPSITSQHSRSIDDSGTETSPSGINRGSLLRSSLRSNTGLYDNVECYSPGPDYGPIPSRGKKSQPSPANLTSELFINCSSSSSNNNNVINNNANNAKNAANLPREIPIVYSNAPAKPPISPNLNKQRPAQISAVPSAVQVPVWVSRQGSSFQQSSAVNNLDAVPVITPPAPLTPPSNFIQQPASSNSKRCNSQPPLNPGPVVIQAGAGPGRLPHPLGQGSFQDILLMEQVDTLLEFSEKPGEKGLVKAGPTDALIVYASLPSSTESHRVFVDAFLTTYCTFLTPEQLVDKLIYRFEKLSADSKHNSTLNLEDPKQKLGCSTLCLLVHVVSSLSTSDALFRWPQMRSRLAEFVYSLLRRPGLWHLAVALRRELLRAEANLQTLQNSNSSNANMGAADLLMISPISQTHSDMHPKRSSSNPPTLLDFKSRRIAEQMTLLDWKLFESLDLAELLTYATHCGGGNAENSIKGAELALQTPRLTNFTRHFNNVSLWARTIILKQDSDKMRERYMLKLAKVVQHLRQLQNFNSSLALLSALDSAAVLRLASAARVVKRIKSVVNGLRDLTDSSGSFKAYRAILENCHPPAIPYLGLTLSDLTFLHLGCPDVLREDASGGASVNFEKRLRQHRILESVRRFKASHAVYSFNPEQEILVFFDNFSDHWEEERCWTESERIKPRTPMGSANAVHNNSNCAHQSHAPICVSSSTKH